MPIRHITQLFCCALICSVYLFRIGLSFGVLNSCRMFLIFSFRWMFLSLFIGFFFILCLAANHCLRFFTIDFYRCSILFWRVKLLVIGCGRFVVCYIRHIFYVSCGFKFKDIVLFVATLRGESLYVFCAWSLFYIFLLVVFEIMCAELHPACVIHVCFLAPSQIWCGVLETFFWDSSLLLIHIIYCLNVCSSEFIYE